MELGLLRLTRNLGRGLYCCLQLSIGRVEKMDPNSSQRGSVSEEAMDASMRDIPVKHKEKLFLPCWCLNIGTGPQRLC